MPNFSKSIDANSSFSGADMVATITITGGKNNNSVICVLGDIQTLSYSLHMERGAVRRLGNINAIDHTNGPRTIAGSLVFAVFDRHFVYQLKEQLNVEGELLADELPPFDITISFANEYGKRSTLRIYGVRLINEGEVLSINDVYTENTYQYIARNIQVLKPDTAPIPPKAAEQKQEQEETSDVSQVISVAPLKPTLVMTVKEFIATFNVAHSEEEHLLTIESLEGQIKKRIKKENWPYEIKLKPNYYQAYLDDEVINRLHFSIFEHAQAIKTPYIFERTDTSIKGKCEDPQANYALCISEIGDQLTLRIDDTRYFSTQELKPDTNYTLIAYSDYDGKYSMPVAFKTLPSRNKLITDAVQFIAIETNTDIFSYSKIRDHYLNHSMSLTEAFYELASSTNEVDSELIIKLANYYELGVLMQNDSFDIENRWLNLYSPTNDYQVFKSNGITSYYKPEPGLTLIKECNNHVYRTLPFYLPSGSKTKVLIENYNNMAQKIEDQKERFKLKYAISSHYFDAIDYEKVPNGSYLLFENHTVTPVTNDPSYLVIMEDCNPSAPQIRIPVNPYKSYSLLDVSSYDPDKNYYIYLEDKAKNAISRGYATLSGYLVSTFIAIAKDIRFKDTFLIERMPCELPLLEVFGFCMEYVISQKHMDLIDSLLMVWHLYFYKTCYYQTIQYEQEGFYFVLEKSERVFYFDKVGSFTHFEYTDIIPIEKEGYAVVLSQPCKPLWLSFSKAWIEATTKGADC